MMHEERRRVRAIHHAGGWIPERILEVFLRAPRPRLAPPPSSTRHSGDEPPV